MALLCCPLSGSAQSREYQVKAAFLYNFAQFVEWPSNAFTNATQPFRIGVLGDNPFGDALANIVRGETIGKREVVLQQSNAPEDLLGCQMVYIAISDTNQASRILAHFNSRPVLTVAELDGAGRHGAIIRFYRDGPRVRFEIDPKAAEKAGLKVRSEMLRLGRIVSESAEAQQ